MTCSFLTHAPSLHIHPCGVHIIQPTPWERCTDSRQPGWLCDATPLKSCNKPATSAVHLLLRSEAGSLWSPAAELTSNVTLSLSFCPLCFSFPFFFSLYTSRDRQSDADTHSKELSRFTCLTVNFGINSRMQRNNSVTFSVVLLAFAAQLSQQTLKQWTDLQAQLVVKATSQTHEHTDTQSGLRCSQHSTQFLQGRSSRLQPELHVYVCWEAAVCSHRSTVKLRFEEKCCFQRGAYVFSRQWWKTVL